MPLVPRVRLNSPSPTAATADALPAGLRDLYAVTDGCVFENNAIRGARDEGLTEVMPLDSVEHDGSSVVFGRGDFGATFAMDATGAVDVLWSREDRDAVGEDRTRVAPSLGELLGSLIRVEADADFDGHPLVTEVFGERPGREQEHPVSLPIRASAGGAPPVSALSGEASAYFQALPDWLRALLEASNGATIQGLKVRVPTPTGTREVESLTLLLCVANTPQNDLPEASSLHRALVEQGLDEGLYPFAVTEMNATFLTDGAGAVFVAADEAPADEVEPFSDGSDLIANLQQAVQDLRAIT